VEKELKPTSDEIGIWLLATLRHSCQVEYYLHQLDLGHDDPQRPHDISGEGSKYSWPVVKGLALQQRSDDPNFFARHVLPSIEYHRRHQYHHQKWNQSDAAATPDDMKVGAIDTLCSLLEPRDYQGGSHSYDQIIAVIKNNEPHKVKWFWMVYSQMKRIEQLDTAAIISLENIPNIGLPSEMYAHIVSRTEEAVHLLRERCEYADL
jgi:hypothetical protein